MHHISNLHNTQHTKHEHTHPNEVRRDARCALLRLIELLVRRRRGVYHERLRVADVREVAREAQRVDDAPPDVRVARNAEVEDAPVRARAQVALRDAVRRVRGQPEVRDPRDLRVLLEPPAGSVCVSAGWGDGRRRTGRGAARCRTGAARGG